MATLNLDDYIPMVTDANGIATQDLAGFALASTVEMIDETSGFINEIDQNVKHDPSIMAWNVYTNEQMWWILCLVNNIVDPFAETPEGRLILVPNTATARNILNQTSPFASGDVDLTILDQSKGEVIELN